MGKRQDKRDEGKLDEFQAYGEYSYAYRHADDAPAAPAEPEAYPQPEARPPAPAAERTKARARSMTGRLIFLLAVAVATLVVLQGLVFRLRTVYVIGNKHKTPQQVAVASGLVQGLNIFAINEDEIEKNLASDHTIIFLDMQKVYPSTIYLYIDERESVAVMQWLGIQYTLDAEGVVMEESNALVLPEAMPVVTGMQVTNIHVGQRLTVRNNAQLKAYCDIMYELDEQMFSDHVSEMNLADEDSMYLVLTDGITVRLGDGSNIRAKIGAVRTDLEYLLTLGQHSGILDVSIPEDGKYTPGS